MEKKKDKKKNGGVKGSLIKRRRTLFLMPDAKIWKQTLVSK
jgi:hypothetical protein